MGERERWNVIVVGSGFAGLSVAIWARRLGLTALVLEQGPDLGGQLRTIAQPIVDYPGLAGTSGTALSQQLRDQAEAAGAVLRPTCSVRRIDCLARRCELASGTLAADALVLATGLAPHRLGVPGETELAARGLVHRPSREPEWYRGKRVAVIGGGDRAAENALLLTRVAQRVHLLARSARLRARQPFVDAMGEVDLRTETEVTAIRYQGAGVLLDLRHSERTEVLPVDAVCIYIGNRPNTDLVVGQVALTADGYLVTDREGQSSVPGVYGAGDVCTAPAYQSLATAAGQAMVVAKHIALRLM